jgi:beta-glucosidase
MGTPAKCLPVSEINVYFVFRGSTFPKSATAMGATWDVDLIEDVGLNLLAEEAKLKATSLILGPTCNMQRVSTLLASF